MISANWPAGTFVYQGSIYDGKTEL